MIKYISILILFLYPLASYAQTITSCNFTVGSNTIISSYTCGTGGSPSFAKESMNDPCATQDLNAISSSGQCGVLADVNSCGLTYNTTNNPSHNQYYIEATVKDTGVVDPTDAVLLIGRWVNATTYYAASLEDDDAGASDGRLYESSGTGLVLVCSGAGFINNQVAKMEIRNSLKALYKSGTLLCSGTNNAHTATGRGGIGCGGPNATTNRNCDTNLLLDDYSVVELEPASERRVILITLLDWLIKKVKAQNLVRDGIWYISPLVTIDGLMQPKAQTIIDPGQPLLDGEPQYCTMSNAIKPNINWVLSYVKCMDYSALDADPEIIKMYNETDGVDLRLNQLSSTDRNSLRTKVNTRKTRNSTLTNSDTVRKWIEDLGKEINPQFNVDGTYVR
jgi:hypothetical protein